MTRKIPTAFLHLLTALCLLSFSGSATAQDESIHSVPPPPLDVPNPAPPPAPETDTPAAQLLIISAAFGSGTHYSDVTDRVNDLLKPPGAEFPVNPGSLQTDPTPGTWKNLVIIYEFRGKRHIFTTDEAGKVSVVILRDAAAKKRKAKAGTQPPWATKPAALQDLPGGAKYEFRTWHQGNPPIRLIRKEDGYCALTLVTGHFQGGGEVAGVYIGDDGYWYLGGQSGQEGVAAQCIIVHYQ